MQELNQRFQSKIPGPASTYGSAIQPKKTLKYAIYDGLPITAFLHKHEQPHFRIRQFLKNNEIGSAFTDLEPGQLVKLEGEESFAQHPDY